MFEQKNRAYTDNDISEFAGKFLPAHPTTRYKTFSKLWRQTRKISGYVPRPSVCASSEDDYFPCCLSCIAPRNDEFKTLLAHRSVVAGWLTATWMWDFGFTLPEELVGLWDIGRATPEPPAQRDRVFVLTPDNRRSYLAESLQQHAELKGNDLHETKIQISNSIRFSQVAFPGQIGATTSGTIAYAQLRATPLGAGVQVWERYNFEDIKMNYILPTLTHGKDILINSDRITLMGIAIN